MADNLRKYKSLYSSTSNSFSTGTSETITPASVVGLPTDTEITLTFDRVDSSGTKTPSSMERIIGTISGGNFVIRTSPSSGRGVDGSTEQAHTSPVVEMIWNAKDWNDMVDWATTEHNQAGTHTNITACKVTASGVVQGSYFDLLAGGAIRDANDNELVKFGQTASAVNEIKITNAITGSEPTMEVTGDDTNIGFSIKPKGTGAVALRDHFLAEGITDNGNSGASKDIDWSTGDRQKVTLTDNVTFTFSNAKEGQIITLVMTQDATGGRTVTWPATVKWPGGSEPSWGTGASDINTATFYFDGTNYLGQGGADYS